MLHGGLPGHTAFCLCCEAVLAPSFLRWSLPNLTFGRADQGFSTDDVPVAAQQQLSPFFSLHPSIPPAVKGEADAFFFSSSKALLCL